MIDVRAHLARKPLLFDGGMGTYYKAKPGTECEQGNLLDPAGVRKVHREYLAAGAEAIKTNTFGLPRMAAASSSRLSMNSSVASERFPDDALRSPTDSLRPFSSETRFLTSR